VSTTRTVTGQPAMQHITDTACVTDNLVVLIIVQMNESEAREQRGML